MTARLVEMRIRGLRTLADVTLPLGGLMVLIGDNGTGKSSILEALRIARLVVKGDFMTRLSSEHVLASAIRKDVDALALDLRVDTADRTLVYSLSVQPASCTITHEAIFELPLGSGLRCATASGAQPTVHRDLDRLWLAGLHAAQTIPTTTSLFEHGHACGLDVVSTFRQVLEGIDVHLPFEIAATWAALSRGRSGGLRDPHVGEARGRLELFGVNLGNVYQTLKNSGEERWRETLELLQLGLGPELQDVVLPGVGADQVGLELELYGRGRVDAYQLADGELAYLAFVALIQVEEGRTLLAFDEPEHHLHPGLLGRVLQLLEDASTRYPVVLATHSNRVLDDLPDPVVSVRICELDSHYRTHLRQLDAAQLDRWMEQYRGLGDIRASGLLSAVVAVEEDDAA